MKNVLEKLNLALLISHRVYNGRPPYVYRKALRNLLTASLNPRDVISDELDAKLNAAIKAMHNPNINDGLAAIDSLHGFVTSNIVRKGEQIPQADANDLTSVGRKGAGS